MYKLRRYLVLHLVFILLFLAASFATHIVGGNMAYEYQGQQLSGLYRYKIILTTYIDCNSPSWGTSFPESFLTVGIYEGPAVPSGDLNYTDQVSLPLVDSTSIIPPSSSGCSVGVSVCIYQCRYEGTIDVRLSFLGYHLYYDRCCRVGTILNLNNPGAQGIAFHAYIPPSLIKNNSPVFSDIPVPFICVSDTASILNTAVDADGDVLIFSFEDPYAGFSSSFNPAPPLPNPLLTWPIPPVVWNSGYDKNNPFGAGAYSYINAVTGYSQYMAPVIGDYVVAVEIKEYRAGTLIGITRRDMQLLVVNCPNNPPPILSAGGGSGQTSYTINEGDSICFPVTIYDILGDSITLTSSGQLFNSAFVNPAATMSTGIKGDSLVSSQFCWKTKCGQANALPYIFSVSAKDNGCPNKTTNLVYSIQVNPFQGPASINGPNPICTGSSAVAYSVTNVPGETYSWTITGGVQVSGGTSSAITVDWGAPGNGTVQVVASRGTCIAAPTSLSVVINGNNFADAGLDQSGCPNTAVQIGSGSVSGLNYSWSPATGLNNPTISNPTVTLPNAGGSTIINQYIVTASDANGCTDTDTVLVSITPKPTIDAGLGASFCKGDSAQLSATGGTSYSWTPATNLSNTTIATPWANPLSTITYTVTGTDANNCSATDTVKIIVGSSLTLSVSASTTICTGDSVQITAGGASTYTWSPAGSLSSAAVSSPYAKPLLNTTYTVNGTDASGCTGTNTVQVNVKSTAPANAGPDAKICAGDSIQLNGTGGALYQWSPALGLSNAAVSNPWAHPAANTSYTLTIKTISGCIGTDTVNISLNSLPTITGSPSANVCTGDSTQLTAAGAITYVWSPAGGLNKTAISDPLSKPITTTTYTVTGTDANGCKNTRTVTVNIIPPPAVDAGVDKSVCIGKTTLLIATGAITYKWTPSAGLSSSTISNPTATIVSAVTYYVTGTDSHGCTNTDSIHITLKPLPIITAAPANPQICIGDTVALTGTGGIGYGWTPTATLSNPGSASTRAFPKKTTLYYLTGIDASGCPNKDSVLVSVFTVDASDTAVCLGQGVTLTTTAIGAISYLWTPATGLSSTSIANPIASPVIATTYSVTANDSKGCVADNTVKVEVNSNPQALFKVTYQPECENILATFTNNSTGATNYVWHFGDGDTSTLSNPTHLYKYSQSMTISLTAISINECRDTFKLSNGLGDFNSYLVIKQPNVFSPNYDGVNDVFKIDLGGLYEGCTHLQVFDRWGILIYETSLYNRPWDGRNNSGQEVPVGVYYYVYTVRDIQLKGFVQVLR